SYFLYRLKQCQLRQIIFPLGDYTKTEVRVLAKKFRLPVAEKKESQEICFLPGTDYRNFLKARLSAGVSAGKIIDTAGVVLGAHKGIAFYTIGQREGLGVALGFPAYVSNIDSRRNQITLGRKEDLMKKECSVKNTHFVGSPKEKKFVFKVKIRYNHQEARAQAILQGQKTKVRFNTAQFAITPGQSAVFYLGNRVVGGGIIDEVF
ncbi:MAG: tRNA 2-thiouridine(34) synthase MnmA, partial [Candidatus Omnitrophica bacterium]|nr:tRNA 2-thiouridine(34) synthase MnmA [Candidatus Omnitrophota bacterium]